VYAAVSVNRSASLQARLHAVNGVVCRLSPVTARNKSFRIENVIILASLDGLCACKWWRIEKLWHWPMKTDQICGEL